MRARATHNSAQEPTPLAPRADAAQRPKSFCGSVTAYQGVEGTRPYAGAAWYYAEYRGRVSDTFLSMLAQRLGWSSRDRILDLGAGPGQLSLPLAALVGEVVALEPEADMVAEGTRRARSLDVRNVRFVVGSSDDLTTLRSSLGSFRAVVMGSSFHWMVEKDLVLQQLSELVSERDGSVVFVTPWPESTPDELTKAQNLVHELLERRLSDVPEGPHPRARHDPFEEILTRSPFPRVERFDYAFDRVLRPTVESLIGYEYTVSHTLARLGSLRPAFEREVEAALGSGEIGEFVITQRDEALIGLRDTRDHHES